MHFLIIFLTLSMLAGCAHNPVTGSNDFVMLSESQEIAEGRQGDAQVKKQYRVYGSKALQDYVNSVGQRIAKKAIVPICNTISPYWTRPTSTPSRCPAVMSTSRAASWPI